MKRCLVSVNIWRWWKLKWDKSETDVWYFMQEKSPYRDTYGQMNMEVHNLLLELFLK